MRLRRLISSEEGSALIEVALALPVLVLMLGGTVDVGLYEERKMQVVEAASAAAAFGAQGNNQLNVIGMQTAASAASPSLTNLVVAASMLWTCTPGGAAVSASAKCGNGGSPLQYVVVATSANVSVPMPLASLGWNLTVSAKSTYRVRWKPS